MKMSILSRTTRNPLNSTRRGAGKLKKSASIPRGGIFIYKVNLTSHSSMKDSNGRLVALPLRHGSPFCLIHAKPFVHCPADLASVSGPIVLMFLDLETTSTDVTTCRIVEFACCSLPGANFAAVVKVPNEILAEPSARAAAMVHGIKDSEILEGALFPVIWNRFSGLR